MTDHAYDEGKRDGKIESLEAVTKSHGETLLYHDRSINRLEKTSYVILVIIVLTHLADSKLLDLFK